MPDFDSLFSTAFEKRGSHRLPTPGVTNAYRLIDGSGDGLPGIEIDVFNEYWLLATRATEPLSELLDWLRKNKHSVYHKQLDQHHKTSPSLLTGKSVLEPFLIKENGLSYEISFSSGYSQGVFIDQRENRLRLRNTLQAGQTVLNTFSYTGAFSIAAAAAGARATTLDLSQPYLDWAKRNFVHNKMSPEQHYFCKGDTFAWLLRFAKQGRKFDAIILDPPTFSRTPKGKVFRVEKDYPELLTLALACLAPHGFILASTNCRQLSLDGFRNQLKCVTPTRSKIESTPMPPDFTAPAYLKSLWIYT